VFQELMRLATNAGRARPVWALLGWAAPIAVGAAIWLFADRMAG
jgi:hypothetical protein